jgi:hypothetical protein
VILIEAAGNHASPERELRQMPTMSPTWIARIKQHALDHYNEDGWDYVVESYTDDELAEVAAEDFNGRKAATYKQALANVRRVTRLLDERRRDVSSTAW